MLSLFWLLPKALGEGAKDDGHEQHCKTILYHTNNAYNHEQHMEGICIKEELEKQNNVFILFFFSYFFSLKAYSSTIIFAFLLRFSLPILWLWLCLHYLQTL